MRVEAARFDAARIPFDNGDGFFNTANYAAETTVIRTDADAVAWIARLRALPMYFDQQIDNLKRGIASGFVQPQSTASSVLAILKLAADQPAAASPLLAPLTAAAGLVWPAPAADLDHTRQATGARGRLERL